MPRRLPPDWDESYEERAEHLAEQRAEDREYRESAAITNYPDNFGEPR